jgi:PPOX class probable F420-dependent enzyme
MSDQWLERVRPLLDSPAPAVLATYRRNGEALVSPVWFRWSEGAFEVVIAEGDVKLRHLRRDPRCVIVVFEAVAPFRGIELRGVASLSQGDVSSVRCAIASRYLGTEAGERFAEERASLPAVVVRIPAESPRVWDLSSILPR